MKLLVSWMRALSRYVSREFYYTMQDLMSVHGWRHLEPAELARGTRPVKLSLQDSVGEVPQVTLFWETYDLFNAVAPELRELGCRTALFADDLHLLSGDESKRDSRLQAFAQCDLALTSYGYMFDEFYPELRGKTKVIWTPHAASPDFALPFNDQPKNAIFLSGAIGSFYPLRVQLRTLLAERGDTIVHHQHPGYGEAYDYESDTRIGRGYAKRIHECKAAFTDAGSFRYVVAKHFEIPATGALLVADAIVRDPLKRLGFAENIHYISVSAENLENSIRYIVDEGNRPEVDAIRRRGQELVLATHTTSDRARLIDRCCGCDATDDTLLGLPYD
jgi:Glycosyl transferases group 1